jgi:hypothetical protein
MCTKIMENWHIDLRESGTRVSDDQLVCTLSRGGVRMSYESLCGRRGDARLNGQICVRLCV